MSTYPMCSECSEILWELAETEAGMCEKCQKELMGFNLSYALTKFESSIPDSKPTRRNEPVTCPLCKKQDENAAGHRGVVKCLNCGMLYFILRRGEKWTI